jgi:hypothetical protein
VNSSGVGLKPSLLSSSAADSNPASELRFVGAGQSRQLSLRPAPGRVKHIDFGPAEREPGVRGEQVRAVASELSQFRHGRVRVVDPVAGAMTAADARNSCRQELVSAAHIGSLERAFAHHPQIGMPRRHDRVPDPSAR